MNEIRSLRKEYLIGALFIAAGIALSAYNFREVNAAGNASKDALVQIQMSDPVEPLVQTDEVVYPDYVLNPDIPMPVKEINGMEYAMVIDIPTLGVELPVLSGYQFDWLKISPCRYKGSVYTEDLVLCSHNYVSHFGRLGEMAIGDEISITDMNENRFVYEVKEILILDPKETEEFTENGYALTLFTCTYGGAARISARCDLVDPDLTSMRPN